MIEFFQILRDEFPLFVISIGIGFFLLGQIWRQLKIFITGGTDDEQKEPEEAKTFQVGSEIVYGPSGDHFMYDDSEGRKEPSKPVADTDEFITCQYCGAANEPKARACISCGAPRRKAFSS